MIVVSEGYHAAICASVREMKSQVEIGTHTFDSGIDELKITENGSDSTAISMGAALSNQLDLKLRCQDAYVSFETEPINVYEGVKVNGEYERVPLGRFYPKTVDTTDEYRSVTIKAFDALGRPEAAEVYEPGITFPADVNDVLDDLCSKLGLEHQVVLPKRELPGIIADSTIKQNLGWLAGIFGFNARINKQGYLVFDWYTDNNVEVPRDIQYQEGYTHKGNLISINAVTSGFNENVFTSGASQGIIFENPYITADEVQQIYNRIVGTVFQPCQVKWRGNPAAEIIDILKVETSPGVYCKMFVSQQTLDCCGGFSTDSVCERSDTNTSITFGNSPTDLKIKQSHTLLQQALTAYANLINGSVGGVFRVTDVNGDGVNDGWIIANTEEYPLPSDAKCIIANRGGIGFSDDGGKTYKTAITFDGIVGEAITGNIIVGEELHIVNEDGKDLFSVMNNEITLSVNATKKYIQDAIGHKTEIFGENLLTLENAGDFAIVSMEIKPYAVYKDLIPFTYEELKSRTYGSLARGLNSTQILKIATTNKNMLLNEADSKVVDGVTFTVNADGSITLNGKSTADIEFTLSGSESSTDLLFILNEGETYIKSGLGTCTLALYSYDGTEKKLVSDAGNGTITLDTMAEVTQAVLCIPKGVSLSDVTISPQLEKGTSATSYVQSQHSSAIAEFAFDFGDTITIQDTLLYISTAGADRTFVTEISPLRTYNDMTIVMVNCYANVEVTYYKKQDIYEELDGKVGSDEIISRINLSSEEAQIKANKIKLEGYTTINDGFSVDEQGNMRCNNATAKSLVVSNGLFTLDEKGNINIIKNSSYGYYATNQSQDFEVEIIDSEGLTNAIINHVGAIPFTSATVTYYPSSTTHGTTGWFIDGISLKISNYISVTGSVIDNEYPSFRLYVYKSYYNEDASISYKDQYGQVVGQLANDTLLLTNGEDSVVDENNIYEAVKITPKGYQQFSKEYSGFVLMGDYVIERTQKDGWYIERWLSGFYHLTFEDTVTRSFSSVVDGGYVDTSAFYYDLPITLTKLTHKSANIAATMNPAIHGYVENVTDGKRVYLQAISPINTSDTLQISVLIEGFITQEESLG